MQGEMELAIRNWSAWLLAEGRSAGTVAAYAWDVGHVARSRPDLGLLDWKAQDLADYLAARALAGVSDQARKRCVSALKSFWLHHRGRRSPAAKLRAPTPKRRQQRALSWDQAGAVLAACDPSTARGLRDLALVCLLLESGLRAAEACRLELGRLDLRMRRLWVRVKGGHEAEGSFDVVTASYIEAWLTARPQLARSECRAVFVSVGGTTPGRALTPRGLGEICAKIGRAAGLPALSPHDLRRTCATLKTRMGAPTRAVQVGGRWSNLREVERYTASLDLDTFAAYSPVAALVERGAASGPALTAVVKVGAARPQP